MRLQKLHARVFHHDIAFCSFCRWGGGPLCFFIFAAGHSKVGWTTYRSLFLPRPSSSADWTTSRCNQP